MNIIYGRSGTGKSEYIYNKIKADLSKGINEKIYIITPEQFSFTAEKKLLETLDEGATTNVEVLSFERMAYRVIKETYGNSIKNLVGSGKAMIISTLLEEHQKELNFLGKNQENIDVILTEITEFKKHNISPYILEERIEKIKDNYLKLKLKDILLIYSKFNERIEDKYVDENDILSILAKNIKESHLFDNTIIYIDEFAGFTKQEYLVIKEILDIAKEVYITVCTDSLKVINSPEADIFYDNKQTIQTLKTIGEIDKEIYLDTPYRFKNEELKHLEKNIFDIPYTQYEKNVENIRLTIVKNEYDEIEYIAKEIINLVRKNNYRYRDIGIITKNLDTYSSLCKAIFNEYDIPVFIDEKKDITSDNFIKYVLSILDIFAKNWSYESVFNYLKSGMIKIDRIYELEKYCLKWNIKGKKWYEKEWSFEVDDNFIDEQKRIILPLLELKNSLNSLKTADEISEKLYDYIISNIDIDESKINVESYNLVIDVLDEIVELFKGEKVSFDTYIRLLKTGISNKELGQIPQTNDKVTVGDINRSKTHKIKALFIIGVNDGVFPSRIDSEGYFNDKDREMLKKEGLEIAKGTIEKMYEENFNIYKAFSTAEEKIYISYPKSDSEDKPLRKSSMITRMQKIFPKLIEKEYINDEIDIYTKRVTMSKLLQYINNIYNLETEEEKIIEKYIKENHINEIYNWYKKDKEWSLKLNRALEGLEYTNLPEKLDKENVKRLYGNTLNTTVSRLESYRSCGFSYFLKYGLKLSEKEKMNIKPIDTGTFMHDVIDTFFKEVQNVKSINDEELKEKLNKIIEEKLELPRNYIFTANAKYRNLVARLKKVIFLSMRYIIQSLKNSKFDVLKTELEFGNTDYPPIEMYLEDGRKISITGKIDRVDIAKDASGKYIRIIDYKSSTKDIELNKVISGLQLQLITYVDALSKNNSELVPAGALYFSLIEPKLTGAKKDMTKEEIEEIIKKNYKMDGLILADVNVIRMMDDNLEVGKSDTIPVTLNDDGNINFKNSKVVTKEEFEALQSYTIKIIKEISKEILDGNIKLKPYYIVSEKKSPCTYCEYKSICQFNPRFAGNEYLYVTNKPRQEILDEICKRNSKT